MITRQQLSDLGFQQRNVKSFLRRNKKANRDIPNKHSVLKLNNGITLLIRGHKIFYIDNYTDLMQAWEWPYIFFERLWKYPNLDISKVSLKDIKRIVEAADKEQVITYSFTPPPCPLVIDLRGSVLTEEMFRKGLEFDDDVKPSQSLDNSDIEVNPGDQSF